MSVAAVYLQRGCKHWKGQTFWSLDALNACVLLLSLVPYQILL